MAVTGDDSKVHVYRLAGSELTPKTEIEHLGPVTDCAYSPDLKYLVASDANRKVILYSVADDYKVSDWRRCGEEMARGGYVWLAVGSELLTNVVLVLCLGPDVVRSKCEDGKVGAEVVHF